MFVSVETVDLIRRLCHSGRLGQLRGDGIISRKDSNFLCCVVIQFSHHRHILSQQLCDSDYFVEKLGKKDYFIAACSRLTNWSTMLLFVSSQSPIICHKTFVRSLASPLLSLDHVQVHLMVSGIFSSIF